MSEPRIGPSERTLVPTAFRTLATESGALVFTWEGDNNFAQTETRTITVT